MFKHYLKIAFRNIIRNRLFTVLNVLGLAVSMACFILIFLWVQDEISYDKFHLNKDELYLINIKHPGDLNGYGDPNAPFALAPTLAGKYPEIIDYTRVFNVGGKTTCTFKYRPVDAAGGEKMFYEDKVYFVDASFFTMFSFPFVYGNPRETLVNRNSVVISHKISKKYFAEENPIGKVLSFNNRQELIVTGVVRVPSNSHLQFDFITPLKDKMLTNWNWSDPSYLLLKKDISLEEFRKKISGSLNEYYPGRLPGTYKVDILPLLKNHLYFGREVYVYIFSFIAFFILLIACLNYMNLATASSAKRAKEVGIRKTIGAKRLQVIKQFFGESILLSVLSILPATALANMFLPFLNEITGKNLILFSLDNPTIFIFLFALGILVGTASGCYPALFLTSHKPVQTLRMAKSFKRKRSPFRVASVVGQFVISILLIICTTVIFKQLSYIQNRPLGFKSDYVIGIPINRSLLTSFQGYKNELLSSPGVLKVTAGQAAPFNEDYKTGGTSIHWENKDPQVLPMVRYSINQIDYIETFDIKVAAGRSFREDFPGDRTNYMINEAAVKYMNLKEPLGKRLKFWKREGKIIGVVKDFHHVSLHREILPQIFTINPHFYSSLRFIFIKIESKNIPGTIDKIRKITGKFAPAYPFKYNFLDKEMGNLYHSEQRLGKIFSYSAFWAIFISCLGIFGLAAFSAEQKTKEIGIRKVLGASIANIIKMVSKEFVILVMVSNIIAWPLAYFIMNKWLQDFAYKTGMGIGIFILSGLMALFIALITVSYQAVKAALTNPLESLRYE
ncbi:MAG: ABC transporter permease [Candidatus Aminicenantes bacterium]|nr:ABC transporter permease [Candidatus Aminicenantes bacterium]